MARTAVEITREQYEAALKEAKLHNQNDPRIKADVDKARDAYIGALSDERLEKGSDHVAPSL